MSDIENSITDVVKTHKTKNYYTINSNKQYIIKEDYEDVCLFGTSITLNDLRYDPKLDGHRLYIRDDCASYEGDPRAVVYYRKFDDWASVCVGTGGDEHKNHLYLHTGPCFVPKY
jgi:hypothetical protein